MKTSTIILLLTINGLVFGCLEYFIGYQVAKKKYIDIYTQPHAVGITNDQVQKAIDETDANYKCNDCEIKGLYNSNEQPLNTPGVYTQMPEEAKR